MSRPLRTNSRCGCWDKRYSTQQGKRCCCPECSAPDWRIALYHKTEMICIRNLYAVKIDTHTHTHTRSCVKFLENISNLCRLGFCVYAEVDPTVQAGYKELTGDAARKYVKQNVFHESFYTWTWTRSLSGESEFTGTPNTGMVPTFPETWIGDFVLHPL